jgi:hypothetical protein
MPGALTTPTPAPASDRNARVMILCYHRFEDRPHDSLAISPAEFRAQMQALKDNGIAVIAMKDFLAWRQGEKNIPPRSCISALCPSLMRKRNIARNATAGGLPKLRCRRAASYWTNPTRSSARKLLQSASVEPKRNSPRTGSEIPAVKERL